MSQMPSPSRIVEIVAETAAAHCLMVMGVAATKASDPVPDAIKSVLLLGPKEPGFWSHFIVQPEKRDGGADAIDRWSERAVSDIAETVNGIPIFPFGGPPYAPFINWALVSGRSWVSPVGLLVHDTAGLFASFRGAVGLPFELPGAKRSKNPCLSCKDQPCVTACPVAALSRNADYDVAACHRFLETEAGNDCMTNGCAVRRVCPVSQGFGRQPAQSAFHMKAFHK